jgi:hypothetical protein
MIRGARVEDLSIRPRVKIYRVVYYKDVDTSK